MEYVQDAVISWESYHYLFSYELTGFLPFLHDRKLLNTMHKRIFIEKTWKINYDKSWKSNFSQHVQIW